MKGYGLTVIHGSLRGALRRRGPRDRAEHPRAFADHRAGRRARSREDRHSRGDERQPRLFRGTARGSRGRDVGIREGARRLGHARSNRCSRSTAARRPPGARRAATSSPTGFADFATAVSLPEDERLLALPPDRRRAPGMACPRVLGSLLAPVSTGFPGRHARALGRRPRAPRDSARVGNAARSSGNGRAGGRTGRAPRRRSRPGSAVTALLIDGDLQLGATGTVTRVDGEGRFLAFGHPFLGAGTIELPAAPAEVVTVFPSAMLSFKVAYALAPVYRLTHDRDSGVAGRTDRTVPFVPVRFPARVGRRERAHAVVGRRARAGPASHAPLDLPGRGAHDARRDAGRPDSSPPRRRRHEGGAFVYADQMTGPRAKELALMTANVLTGLVAQNEYEEPGITGVDVSIVSTPGERRLRIVEAALSTRKAAPGETLHATVRLVDRRGAEQTRVLSLTVPEGDARRPRDRSRRGRRTPPPARASRPSRPSRAASRACATRSRGSFPGTASRRSCSSRHAGRRRETAP